MSADDQPSPREASSHTEAIEVVAAAWLSLRDRGLTPEQTTEFVHWLQQDPRHQEIFDELDQIWKSCGALDVLTAEKKGPPLPDLLAPRARPRRRKVMAWAALAAAAIVVLALPLFNLRGQRPFAVTTRIGELSHVDLPDGSRVQVNTGSKIAANFTDQGREIHLTGESFFSVKPDARRPFTVRAGPVVVHAVGTAFSVREHAEAVEVLVTEGRVRILDRRTGQDLVVPEKPAPSVVPTLRPGERALVPLDPTTKSVAAAPVTIDQLSDEQLQQALAWQSERLVFDAVPLAEVVAEFNRYNDRRLVIADEQLAPRRFSGTFRTDGVVPFVRLLESNFGVVASEADGAIVLRSAP